LHISIFSLFLLLASLCAIESSKPSDRIVLRRVLLLVHQNDDLLLRFGSFRSVLPTLLDRLDESDNQRDSDGSEQGRVDGVLVLVGLRWRDGGQEEGEKVSGNENEIEEDR